MTWRTYDSLGSPDETVKLQFFKIGSGLGSGSSFQSFNPVVELLLNSHKYVCKDLCKVYAKYLFVHNDKASVFIAYKAEETIMLTIGYKPQPRERASVFFGASADSFCGEAYFANTTANQITTMSETAEDSISSYVMPGEVFRFRREDVKLTNLKLML